MLSALFGAVGRHFWPVTGLVGVGALLTAWLGDYQTMALLGCTFGSLLMWDAERHDAPLPALKPMVEADALAQPAR